jgi:LacI family repressor for deo operon, udp, cdd, tsx, nupC, and nupG
MPTIRQLAALAGVSHSTVSRALRDDSQIGAETRQRLQALAREFHYQPNRLSHGALTGKSRLLGFICCDLAVPFVSRILRGICEIAYEADYQVLLVETRQELPRTLQAVHSLLEHRVEGLLFAHSHAAPLPTAATLEIVSHHAVPVLLDFSRAESDLPRVCTDEAALGELAVAYLQRLGHRRIAFVGPPAGGFRGERAAAVTQALRRRGLSTFYLMDWGAAGYQDFSGTDALTRLLSRRPAPTAIIAFEDHVAAKLIQATQARGLHVPGDLSILGCANLNIAEFTAPPLTSVEQHPEEIGRQACRYLLAQLAQSGSPSPVTFPISPTLIERASCAPPAS